MNIIIVGGSGFVSGTLARRAVAAGHTVWAVTRGNRPVPEGVIPVTVDRKDRTALETAIAAAGSRWDLAVDCIGYDERDAASDIAVLGSRCGRLVFISTDFVYDPAYRTVPQPEEGGRYLSEGYGGGKRRAETVFEHEREFREWTVLRPCHIYGPGSLLGCLPEHGRDPDLIDRITRGEPLALVGGGGFLQQPLFAGDLADVILALPDAQSAAGRTFNVCGPSVIESRRYYEIIGLHLGKTVEIVEVPVAGYAEKHPERASFLCDRVCDTANLEKTGVPAPRTAPEDGLAEHVRSLREPGDPLGHR